MPAIPLPNNGANWNELAGEMQAMAAGDADCHADNVGNPVVHIGAAVKAWLDELNQTAEDT